MPMSLSTIETLSTANDFYSLKDKAMNHILNRVYDCYAQAENNRKLIDCKKKFVMYQEKNKKLIKKLIGDIPYEKNLPLNTQITGITEKSEIIIKNIIFESRPNVYVTGNLYIPKKAKGKCPAVLLQCGHSYNGKAYPEYQKAAQIIASGGIIVLVIDPQGQGERIGYLDSEGTPVISGAASNHQQFGTQCFLNGEVPMKYFLSDSLRAIDLLVSLDEVDKEKIGATGISGGGTMTVFLTLFDDRIKVSAPGCWPSDGLEYFVAGTAPDSEQIIPEILKNKIDHYELISCICPRPLLFLASEYDFIPIEGTKKLFDECHNFYKIMNAEKNIQINIAKAPHGYSVEHAKEAKKFFLNYFNIKCENSNIIDENLLSEKQLNCTKSGQIGNEFPHNLFVFDENLSKYLKKNKPSEKEIFDFFKEKVYNGRKKECEYTFKILDAFFDEGLYVKQYLWFTQKMMPCYGILFKSAENKGKNIPITICLWQNGTDDLSSNSKIIRDICVSGRAAFVIDLSTMGKNMPHSMAYNEGNQEHLSSIIDKIAKSLFTMGDSLCALMSYDLLQTIKMIRENMKIDDIELYTKGKYCIFGRITEILDSNLNIIFCDETKLSDIISNEYYDTLDISRIIMPNAGIYLL